MAIQDADVPAHHLDRSSWSSTEQQHGEHVLSGVTLLSVCKAPISELLLKNQPLSCSPWLFCYQVGIEGEKMNHYKSKHHETLYYIHCLYRARQNDSNEKFISFIF